MTRAWIARTVVSAVALVLLLAPASVRGQDIWFGPLAPDYHVGAVKDWAKLFQPTPEWELLASQIQAFIVSTGHVLIVPDDELQTMAADLTRRHIALAIPLQSVGQRPDEPCDNTEGYGDPRYFARVIGKLQRLGVRPQILRLDGPLWFGHYADCKLPIAEVAPRVVETLLPWLQAFPDVVLGDVEGPGALTQFPDWQADYVLFKRDLEARIGRRLTFMQADVNWREPNWPQAILAQAGLAHSLGIGFGVIYNSDSLAKSDEAWVLEAKRHFDELETRYGLIPQQAVFQTWNQLPTHVFPETSPSAQSYLVAQYLLPRTRLTAQRTAVGVRGRLTTASGEAVPGAPITIDTLGDDPNAPPPLRSVSGTVPPEARFAILGVRVNTECWCSGMNDLLLGPLSYRETAGGSVHFEYRYEPPRRPEAGLAAKPVAIAHEPLVHLKVAPGSMAGANSSIFPVTPDARFQFQVPLASLNGQGLFGSVTLIWLDAQRKGFRRENIQVGDDAAPVATAVTDAAGRFAAVLPDTGRARQRPLLVEYPGSATLRAAYQGPPSGAVGARR